MTRFNLRTTTTLATLLVVALALASSAPAPASATTNGALARLFSTARATATAQMEELDPSLRCDVFVLITLDVSESLKEPQRVEETKALVAAFRSFREANPEARIKYAINVFATTAAEATAATELATGATADFTALEASLNAALKWQTWKAKIGANTCHDEAFKQAATTIDRERAVPEHERFVFVSVMVTDGVTTVCTKPPTTGLPSANALREKVDISAIFFTLQSSTPPTKTDLANLFVSASPSMRKAMTKFDELTLELSRAIFSTCLKRPFEMALIVNLDISASMSRDDRVAESAALREAMAAVRANFASSKLHYFINTFGAFATARTSTISTATPAPVFKVYEEVSFQTEVDTALGLDRFNADGKYVTPATATLKNGVDVYQNEMRSTCHACIFRLTTSEVTAVRTRKAGAATTATHPLQKVPICSLTITDGVSTTERDQNMVTGKAMLAVVPASAMLFVGEISQGEEKAYNDSLLEKVMPRGLFFHAINAKEAGAAISNAFEDVRARAMHLKKPTGLARPPPVLIGGSKSSTSSSSSTPKSSSTTSSSSTTTTGTAPTPTPKSTSSTTPSTRKTTTSGAINPN